MTKITGIALDLDDTLNSLTMHILHNLGCDVGPFDFEKFPVEHGYDIIGAWAELTGRPRVPVPMFWEWISRRTWHEAPRSHEFWLLDTAADLVGRENVLIATVPTKSAPCHAAKFDWITDNVPEWCQRQYSITPRKHWSAQEGILLIDDSDKNVNIFREKHGEAILVPRPWNSLHHLSGRSSEYLSTELSKMFAAHK